MGQSNDFVLHALLGLSALHLALLHPEANRSRYQRAALRHLYSGTLAFRRSVDELKPQNSNAIFAFSSISVVGEFALLHPTFEMYCDEQHLIERLLQVFVLLRNVMTLRQSFPLSFYQAIPPKLRIVQGITNAHKPKTTESKLMRIQESGLVPQALVFITQ
jgi:hypothetical protein